MAVHIFSKATQPKSANMGRVIHQFSSELIELWQKSFGHGHNLSRTAVKNRVQKLVDDYYKAVYVKCHRKKKQKHKKNCSCATCTTSISSDRTVIRTWKEKNNELFDIGIAMDQLEGMEKLFYEDQKSLREGTLSNEVDTEYEDQQAMMRAVEEEQLQRDADEERFIMDIEEETMNSTSTSIDESMNLNSSINRSGLVRLAAPVMEASVQTENPQPDRPFLRTSSRYCTDAIKSTCAMVSSTCGVSNEMSHKIVKIVAKELYGHDLYLTPDEQFLGEQPDEAAVADENFKPKDMSFVLPSKRTIADHKQVMASEIESEAALMLLRKECDTKVTIHFDTTSRSNIDGEWPTIITRFTKNGESTEYRLRPIFFAYEDRDQITRLFVETFERLALSVSVREEKEISAATLWSNVDALMTDAATKNLGIEDTIPEALGSNHHPIHLLCKSHTVEALDRSNLKVLAGIEKSVDQQKTLEGINPALKSFFRGKTATVEAGIDALLSLITHKSANSCSQADMFEYICEREGVTKRVFLYQQRRFAKLGKAAACILEAKNILMMLLDEVQVSNQLVESCRIYLSSELFITELEVLAYFNHYVTFPFLNCVEVSSQNDLVTILPKLHTDLKNQQTNTLSDYVVKIRGVATPTLSTGTANEILKSMCLDAADAIKLQCGREYGFSDEPQRATNISKLSSAERVNLPSNNCISERDLSKFDKESYVARCRNRRFKAKNIRNNMMLYKCKKSVKVDRLSAKIALMLMAREKKWDAEQQKKLNKRLEEKLKKASSKKDYTRRLLQDCKSWGGPATTSEELHVVLNGKDNQQHILRTEMSYYVHTHKAQKVTHKDLFRINGITYEEMFENLMILLDDEKHESTSTIANLPSNEEVSKKLSKQVQPDISVPTTSDVTIDKTNTMCVVVWIDENDSYSWYLGYIKKQVDDKFLVDHLTRVVKNSDTAWKYPSKEDQETVFDDQIVDCSIIGEWDMTGDLRKRVFKLENAKTISCASTKHVDNLLKNS